MKVVIWSALGRVGSYATGVGKHVLQMSIGLQARDRWDTRALFTSDLWAHESARRDSSLMDAIPGIKLPFSRRVAEGLWRATKQPKIDRWLDGADWVYCPKELYVPVRDARYAVTVHDLYRLEPVYRHCFQPTDIRWRWLLRRALREADLVLTVSNFTKGRVVDLIGIPAGKIRVVGNGVDPGFFEVAHRQPVEVSPFPESRYLLTVGGLTHKKGAPALLAVAGQLLRKAPGLTLVVTGPVEPQYVRELARLPNLRSKPRGFPDEEMHRLVRGAEAALVLSEYEGFGIPALEAMAAGVPVVAASRGSLPEVVADAGLIVDPTQPEHVADMILELVGDRSRREEFVSRGAQHATKYRWDACVDRLCSALEEFSESYSA